MVTGNDTDITKVKVIEFVCVLVSSSFLKDWSNLDKILN